MNINESKLYEYIFKSMDEGLLVIDEHGRIIDVNESLYNILGLKPDDICGNIFGWLEKNEAFELMDAMLNAVHSDGNTETDYINYNNNGVKKILDVQSSYTMYDGGKKLIVIIHDATYVYTMMNEEKASKEFEKINDKLVRNNQLITKAMNRFVTEGVIRDALNLPTEKFRKSDNREVTVLVSDLRGFTAMCEQNEDTKVFELMDYYYMHMMDCISKYDGTILEILGDGILAVFGAPEKDERHAEKAIAAAIEMQNQMKKVNSWAVGNDYPTLMMGIGIATGDAIIGNMGSDLRVRYNAVGKCISQADFLESHTVDGQIFASERTISLAKTELEIRNHHEIISSDFDETISFYSIKGIGYPYDVTINKQKDVTTVVLKKPVRFSFNRLSYKNILADSIEGVIVEISGKHALIETKETLNMFDNIFCSIPGNVYAKVTAVHENGFEIDFTSYDEEFDEWFNNVTKGKNQ